MRDKEDLLQYLPQEEVKQEEDLLQYLPPDPQQQLKANLFAATQMTPIEATDHYKLSKQSNIPVDVLKTHSNEVKQMTEFNSFDVEDLKNNFPKVAVQLQDAAKASAIRDDISSLSYLERWTGDIGQSFTQGKTQTRIGDLGLKRILGQDLTPSEQNEVDLFRQTRTKDYDIGFVAGIPSAVAGTLPAYGKAITSGAIAAAPLALGGLPAYGSGVGIGTIASMGLQEAGSAYIELDNLKDDKGQPLDEDVKKGAAITIGIVNGALEKFGLGYVAKKFPGVEELLSGFTKDKVIKKIQGGLGTELFKNIGKAAVTSGIAEGSTEGLQEFSSIVFTELAKSASSGDFTSFGKDKEGNVVDPNFWAKARKQIVQSSIKGVQGGAGLSAAGGAMTVAYDRTLAKKQNEFEQTKISDALKTTKESKIFKRDPELFVDATENTLGEQNIYIPADKAKEFFQSEDDYNKFISVVPEAGEQFQEALDVGGNLVLPANKVLSAMAQNPSFEALQEWMKLTPESLNNQEFSDSFFNEILPETQKENSKANEIQSNIEKQLTQSGLSPESARLSSQAFKAFYETQSARLGEGQGKQALDKSFDNLIIQNKTAPAFKQISKIDDLDLFIDKARRPQKSVKTGKPLLKMLKDKGGVKLGSNLAGELQHMGINHKTAPGLFRKKGGLGDIDNIPFSEFQNQFPNANLKGDEDNTYVDRIDLLEAISNEMRGQDISQNVDEQRDAINNFLEELDRYTEVDIKTATNQEVKDAIKKIQEGTYNQSQTNQAPTFYSQLEKQITNLPQAKGSPEQWAGIIKNLTQKGVKQEELDWTGIEDWIKEQKGSVSKEQILDYLKANKIEVEEVVKGATTFKDITSAIDEEKTPFGDGFKKVYEGNKSRIYEIDKDEFQIFIKFDGQWQILDTKKTLNLAKNRVGDVDNNTKFSKYTLAGGENYRELLMTLPTKRSDSFKQFLEDYRKRFPKSDSSDEEIRSFYDKGVLIPEAGKTTSKMSGDIYKSSHYDEPNILAHLRFNERTDAEGNKVMFVEELQSDWHQEGRKEGYKLPKDQDRINKLENEAFELEKERQNLDDGIKRESDSKRISLKDVDEALKKDVLSNKRLNQRLDQFPDYQDFIFVNKNFFDGNFVYSLFLDFDTFKSKYPENQNIANGLNNWLNDKFSLVQLPKKSLTEQEVKYVGDYSSYKAKRQSIQNKITELYSQANNTKNLPPNAPFKTTWNELVFKRALMWAVENDFDKVAWTTGAQQAERYDLSKQVDKISYSDEWKSLVAEKNGQAVINRKSVQKEDLDNLIGKELAGKIRSQIDDGKKEVDLSGLDLKVGGEGMKAFYDKIVPTMVNKLTKKFGGKVEDIELKDTGNVHSLEITPAMRDLIRKQGLPLFQRQGEDPKGSIEFNAPDGKTIINLFEGRNASTILHEAGHFFLEVNKQIASFEDTSEQIKKDWQSTLDWLGSKDGNFTRDQHEQFARGFEAYLYEGKAPSIELRDTFRRFKSWLVRIYQDIKSLNVKVSKEVAGVFDRMLATDEQIEALKSNPMFRTDPEITKMLTSAEKADYIRRNEKSLEKAKELLLRKTLKQKERENNKFWNEEKEQIRKETEERFNQNPLYNAVHFLKTGKLLAGETELEPFKMDRQSVKDINAEMIKYLPDGILGKNGADPEIVAETFGFSSADEMFKAMMNLPNMKEEINKSVDEEMYRRYGNMLNDGSLEREALEDIHNEDKGGQIAFEMDVINRKTGKQSINKEQFAIKAREILGSKKVNDAIKPSQYYLAELKASREAGKALGSKDYEKASEWKRKQLLNHYLFKESLLAKKKTEKALKKFSVYSEKQTKGKVKIDEDYRQKIVEILGNYNLAPKLSNAKADRLTAEALSAWMTEKQTNDDAQFITPLELLNARDKTHYRDMTLDEFSSLNDLVENIAAQGRFLRTILIDGKREALAEIGQTLSETIYKNVSEKEKAYETRTTWENTKFAAENFFLNIVKARTLIREMDGFKDLGTAHNYLMRDIDKSSLVRIERSQKVAEDMAAIYKKSFGKKSLAQKVFIPEINKSLSKEAIITVGLNWGNQDNRTKLMDGWNWSEGQANSILRNLTEQDWVYIQDTWNYLNSFWEEVAALEKRRYGVIPEKVQSSPFTIGTKDGKTVSLEGGYYPLKYDDRASLEVGKQGLDDLVKSLRSFSGAQTKRGHTINRVSNVELPVRLDKAPLFQHLDAVVMDLTMSETLENTYKILQNKGVRKAISNTLGKNAFEQLDIWLKDLAAAGAMASSSFEAGLSHMRAGIAISTMTFKISTMVQQITGLAQTFATLGAKYSILGVAKAFGNGNPMQINRNIALVLEKSKFMKNRSITFHRDIYDAMQTMKGKGKIKTSIIKAGFYGIVKTQMLVDMPTWMGAYQKGLKDFGGNEVKAVELADLYVLRSQGSGMMKDLSGFERGSTSQTTRLSPLVKLFTVFYSYFNTKYNIAYEKVKQTNFKSPKDLAFLATDFALLFIVEGIMSAALLRKTPDFEDDDDKEAAMIYWGAKLAVQNLASMIPFVSQISSGLQGFDSTPSGLRGFSAITQGIKTTGSVVKQVYEGEDVDIIKAIQVLNGAAGIIFHYSSSQINVMLRAMDKANKGDEVNPLNYLIYKE